MTLQAKIPVGLVGNTQKTLKFTLQFIDSYQFLTSSLAKLASNLESAPVTEGGMLRKYPRADMNLLRRKGVFPYTYFDSLARLSETALPPREAFRNDLDGQECSQSEYAHALDAWERLECTTFGEYMARYLELDVHLLADVFESFRGVSRAQDGMDPCWFITLPSLSYASAFRFTRETIHLLQDAEMYTMFERGIRGGLTFTNKHLARASEGNAEEEMDTVLAYVDENNLYGNALCQYLPHSEFEWIGDSGHESAEAEGRSRNGDVLAWLNNEANIRSIAPDADYGYVLEVDLHYPPAIHDLTADYPLAGEQGTVETSQFSPYMKELYRQLHNTTNLERFTPYNKLLLTQEDKRNYVVHYGILQFYLEMGMQLISVRRAIRFRQKAFLRPYIEFNSKKRQEARNAFEKDFFKLKNNSLFGKTMEDVRKRITYLLKTDVEEVSRLARSPLFHDRDIITEVLTGVHMLKPTVELNKPIYIGQAVLDHSKLEMYRLFYGVIKAPGPLIADVKLLAGDTDSFFLELKVRKVENEIDERITSARDKVFYQWRELLDSSNYPPEHPLFSERNKARLGCFKDETGGRVIEEAIFLRPKMYSMKFMEGSGGGIKRAKGIGRRQVEEMGHETYKRAYENAEIVATRMTILRSVLHTVQTVSVEKRALSAWDDKRYWLSANESLPYGHYRTTAADAE